MKRTALFLLIFLFSTPFHIFGQTKKTVYDAKFELSAEVKGKGFGFQTLGSDGTHTYSLSVKGVNFMMIPIGFKYIINKFDSKMNLVLSKKVPMKTPIYKLGMYRAPLDMKMIDNRLIQTVSTLDKKTATRSIYLIEYDKDDLTQGNTLEVGSFPEQGKQKNSVVSLFDPKNNQEFALIVQSSSGPEKSKATLFVVNNELESTLKTEFEVEGDYEKTSFGNYIISENSIAFTCKTRGGKNESDKLDFYMIDRKTENVQQFEISLGDIGNSISDFECALDGSGKLHISGFYSSGVKKSNDSGGVFTQIYDTESGEKVSEDIHPFTFDFVTENMSEKQKSKTEKKMNKGKDYDIYEYLVREVIPAKDGSSILVAERFRYYETTYTDSKGNRHTTPHYIHADLITVRTNKAGEIEWVQRFKKFHHATNPMAGQMLFHHVEDYFYVVYMEDSKMKMAEISKADGNGKSKEVFTKDQIGNYIPALGSRVQTSPTDYMTQLIRIKKAKVLTISFEK